MKLGQSFFHTLAEIFLHLYINPSCIGRFASGVKYCGSINHRTSKESESVDMMAAFRAPFFITTYMLLLLSLSSTTNTQSDSASPHNVYKRAFDNGVMQWPNARIPYVIDSSFPASDRAIITQVMDQFHEYTPIRFVPRSSDNSYIDIRSVSGICSSGLGRKAPTTIRLDPDWCFTSTKPGAVHHELMHAIGFVHEHQQSGRDSCVQVSSSCTRDRINYGERNTNTYGEPYDYKSVMHYSAGTCITLLRSGVITSGQKYQFTQVDVNKLNKMYNTTPPTIPRDRKWDSVTCCNGTDGDDCPDYKEFTPRPSTKTCLHGDATVLTKDAGWRIVKDLLPGDKILVANDRGVPTYETMILDIHHDPLKRDAAFVRLITGNNRTVTLTPKHLIYAGCDLVSAESVKIGDSVTVYDHTRHAVTIDQVTSITHLMADGIYNPLVQSGRVFVGGILTSTYPDMSPFTPQHQHYILWPIRQLMCQLTPEFVAHMLVDRDWYKYTNFIVESILEVYEYI